MKKLLLITLMLFATVEMVTVTGCTDSTVVAPTIASRLVGKWTMQNATLSQTNNSVNNSQTTTFTANDYYDFKADGTITIVQGGATHTGTWKVTNDRVFFTGTNYMDNTTGWETPVLTANALRFHNVETNNLGTSDFTVNLTK